LWPRWGQNVKQKAAIGGLPRLNPVRPGAYQRQVDRECSMRHKYLIAGLAVIFSLSAAPAFATICLGKTMTTGEIVDVINAAHGCGRAMKIFEDCAYTASGDIQLGAAVEKKCEADFRGRLGRSEKQAYQRKMRVCDHKYDNESGTMYRSFTASCRAQVAQHYSQRALKAAGPKPR
jgi:hypothetical protein